MGRIAVHRIGCALLLAVGPLGCELEGELGDEAGTYTRQEIEALFGFLDECEEGDIVVRDATGWTCADQRVCPAGFSHTAEDGYTVCTRTVGDATDVMVKVGDFWIDRYELSSCPGSDPIGGQPGSDTLGTACSQPGVSPLIDVTWFQTIQLCANAGKYLCTNAEWQVAVAGTVDPGLFPPGDVTCAAPPGQGMCNTCSNAIRNTGLGAQCRSRWGAEDMIGNGWEWVADWYVSGIPWMIVNGEARSAWPAGRGYGDDADVTANVNGQSAGGEDGAHVPSLPAAGMRGGTANSAGGAGAYSLNLNHAPSAFGPLISARCCASAAMEGQP